MRNITKVIVIIAAFLFSANTYAQVKIGHINSQEILANHPDTKKAEAALKTYVEQLQKEAKTLQDEFNAKFKEYQAKMNDMTKLTRQTKEEELQSLKQRLDSFQQRAGQETKAKEVELVNPIIEKIKKAINEVGKEKGFTYIIDNAMGTLIYQGSNAVDVAPMVKAKLGMK